MNDKKTITDEAAKLRQRAEEMVREKAAKSPKNLEALSPDEIQKTLHELSVHQIELQIQNEELSRTQTELEIERDRYFNFYNLTPLGYCTLSEQGLILDANLTIATLLGAARGVLVNKPLSRFIHKEDQNIYYRHRNQLFETGEVQEYELRMLKKDGTVFWAHLTDTTAQDAGSAPVCHVVLTDITERKRAAVALEENVRLSKILMDAFPCVALLLRPSTREIVASNQAAVEVGAVPGTQCFSTWGQRDTPCPWCLAPHLWATGKAQHLEVEALGIVWDAHWIPVSADLYMHYAFDITARKRAAENLSASEIRYRHLADSITDVFFALDQNLRYTYWNKASEKLTGILAKDAIGKSIHEVFSDTPDIRYAAEMYLDSFRTQQTRQLIQKTRVLGKEIWVEINAYPSEEGVSVFVKDITERKQVEIDLQAAYTRVEELWSIAALRDADLKTISDHILKTITSMSGSDYGFYGFINEDESVMTIHSWSGEAMKDCSMVDKPQHFPISEAGIWAEAIRKRTAFILNDYNVAHATKKGLPGGHVPLKNLLVVPHLSHGKITSVAAVANRTTGYNQDDINQITAFLTSIEAIVDATRADEALRESEERFKQLFENMAEGVAVYQAVDEGQDFVFVDINRPGQSLSNIGHAEAVGRRITEVFPGVEQMGLLETFRRVWRTGQPEYHPLAHYVDERIQQWVENEVFRLPSGLIVAVYSDTSVKHRLDAALQESELKYRSLIESSTDTIFCVDEKGQYQFTNHLFASTFGKTPDYFIGKTFWDIYPKEHADYRYEAIKRVFQTGISESLEVVVPLPDKTLYFYATADPIKDETGKVILTLTHATDITARKKVEEALVKTQSLTNAIVESTSDLIWSVDPESHGLLTYNHGLSDYFLQWRELQIQVGMRPEDIYPTEEFINRWHELYQRALREGSYTEEYKGIAGSITMLLTFNLLRRDGEVFGITVFGKDITERKQAEEKIQTAQVELQRMFAEAERSRQALLSVVEDQKAAEEQINRLNEELEQRVKDRTAQLEAINREMESFSYSISHDLRTPLRSLNGFSAILMEDYAGKLDEQGHDYLMRIQEASQRMSQLIDDMLNLSRITRREVVFGRVDLSSLARQVAGDLQAQSPDRQVEFEISPDLVVLADHNLMKIALENLLGNSLKFTSKKKQAHITFGMVEQSGARVYFVRDNGTGFNMAYADKLFTPFQRLHSATEYPGTGIGLSIVQRIIARHGGRIWPDAAVEQGATFYFTLG